MMLIPREVSKSNFMLNIAYKVFWQLMLLLVYFNRVHCDNCLQFYTCFDILGHTFFSVLMFPKTRCSDQIKEKEEYDEDHQLYEISNTICEWIP